jgi:hypothetical protein
MPIPDSFSLFDTDLQKTVSTTKSQIPKYDPTLFDDNSKLSNTNLGLFFIERENMLAIANTGLFIVHYDESLQPNSYNIRINFSSSVNDLISIFNISSTTPKKFIKVIQTGKNIKKGLTYITLTDLTNVKFKLNGISAPPPALGNTLQILYNDLISGFLVYLEDGKFVFDFQTFFIRNS